MVGFLRLCFFGCWAFGFLLSFVYIIIVIVVPIVYKEFGVVFINRVLVIFQNAFA